MKRGNSTIPADCEEILEIDYVRGHRAINLVESGLNTLTKIADATVRDIYNTICDRIEDKSLFANSSSVIPNRMQSLSNLSVSPGNPAAETQTQFRLYAIAKRIKQSAMDLQIRKLEEVIRDAEQITQRTVKDQVENLDFVDDDYTNNI